MATDTVSKGEIEIAELEDLKASKNPTQNKTFEVGVVSER